MGGIERFWGSFAAIRDRLSTDPPDAFAMELLRDVLMALDPRLFYHLRARENGIDLILSAEGHAELMPLLAQVRDAAPALPGWGVHVAYEGMLLFAERNEAVFPATPNGDVLYRMAQSGDHLWKPRDIHFSLVFPDEAAASRFRDKVGRLGMRCAVGAGDGASGGAHPAEVTMHVLPSCATITGLEATLDKAAQEFGGRSDGWGCFAVH